MIARSAQAGRIISGKYRVGQIGNIIARNVAPQALEIVVAASLFAENVHDEAAEIEQRPVVRTAAFAMLRFAFQFFVQLYLGICTQFASPFLTRQTRTEVLTEAFILLSFNSI